MGKLLRKCRAIWQIARTIYQIVLQIFIPPGEHPAHGKLLRKCRAIWQIARTIYQIVLQIFIPLGALKAHGKLHFTKYHPKRRFHHPYPLQNHVLGVWGG